MTEKKLQEEDIGEALRSVEKSEGELIFELGEALVYLNVPPGIEFSAPYNEIGQELWEALQFDLYHLICDGKEKEPNNWVKELIGGDIRNLITGILTALISTLSVPLAIAIPASALLIKKGVTTYCEKGRPKKPKNSIKKLLEKKYRKIRGYTIS